MYKVMAVNAGSSSLKYKLYEMPEEKVLCSGNVEKIGLPDAFFGIKFDGKAEKVQTAIPDHAVGVKLVLDALTKYGIVKDLSEIKAVGHRVVQGGKYFSHSVDFDEEAEAIITKLIPLDPLPCLQRGPSQRDRHRRLRYRLSSDHGRGRLCLSYPI